MERLGSREAWAALAGVAAVRRTSPTRLTCLSLSSGNPWEAGSEAVLAASVAGPFPGRMSGEFQYKWKGELEPPDRLADQEIQN